MNPYSISKDLRLYRIDATRSNLHVGDPVAPGTIIGNDWQTGAIVLAEDYGRVLSATFDGGQHTWLFVIRIEPDAGLKDQKNRIKLFQVSAARSYMRPGEEVTPCTVIGGDAATGEVLRAGCFGRVEAVSFSGAEQMLVVLVAVIDKPQR